MAFLAAFHGWISGSGEVARWEESQPMSCFGCRWSCPPLGPGGGSQGGSSTSLSPGGVSHLFHQMLLCPPPNLHLVMNLTFRMNESDIHSLQPLPVPMSEKTPLHQSTHTKGSPGQKQRTKIINPRSTDMFTRTYALTKSKWERDQGDRLQRIQRIQSNCKDG